MEKKSLIITAFGGEIVLGPGQGICPIFLSNDRSYLLLFCLSVGLLPQMEK